WALLEEGKIDLPELKRRRFASLLAYLQIEGDALELNELYLNLLAEQDHLIPGAKTVLQGLQSAGVRMSVITNGLSAVQGRRLAKTQLGGFFETVIISEEIGVAKPFPAFFDHTLKTLKIKSPRQVLVIGDNPGSDILGGQQAGLDTCWYNPKQKQNPLPQRPTYEVNQLEDVLPIILQVGGSI
ncbi:MAG: YjjG family noncanonical pyrimidine nucleotidase, partial [Bacteroidota bacterium]